MKLDELPKLSNGMRFMIISAPYLHSVGVSVGVKYGSVYEPERINGSAHAAEHMLFQGTERRSAQDLEKFKNRHNLEWNAFTAPETVTYMIGAPRDSAEAAVDILSDMVQNSAIDAKLLENEKGAIVNEIMMRADNPLAMLYDTIPAVLFEGQKAAVSGAGKKETVLALARDEMFDVYCKNYTPANMVLSIYGGISKKRATELADRYFGGFQRPYTEPSLPDSIGPSKSKTIEIEKEGLNTTHAAIAFAIPGSRRILADNPRDIVALEVMSGYLSKKLHDEVRAQTGGSDPGISFYPNGTFGIFSIFLDCGSKKFERTNALVLSELEKLINGDINIDINADKVKNAAVLYFNTNQMELDHALTMAVEGAADQAVHSVTLRDFEGVVNEINNDQLHAAAQKYLKLGRAAQVIVRPPK